MTAPQDGSGAHRVTAPTVSTAPTSGTPGPPGARWWHWDALPHHLGRARTSTVILSVLFVAVFTLYLSVRPDSQPAGTSPAGGGSDVEVPVVPVLPGGPTAPRTTEEPAPTTGADRSEDPDEETGTPTTGSEDTSSGPTSTGATTDPTGTSEPAQETPGTPEATTSAPTSSAAP